MFKKIKNALSKPPQATVFMERPNTPMYERHTREYILRLEPLNRGDVYLNRFRVKAPLGRGGYSEVYLVYDLKEKRDVALKLYRLAGQLDHVKAYIERDSIISQRFVHDPIEGLIVNYEVGRLPSGFGSYIIQEYVPNSSSLQDRLENEYTIRPLTAVNIAAKVCTTLEHLHGRGVFHCDVKPLNILITTSNEPILIDLGAARLLGEHITEYAVATIPYSSHEILYGDTVDGRADIFSLGMTLLHMLVGLPEWVESLGKHKDYTTAEITPNFLQLQPTSGQLREYIYKALLIVPSELASFISKSIQTDPNDRYQTISDFKKDLLSYVNYQMSFELGENPDISVKSNPSKFSEVARVLIYRLQFAVDLAELRMLCFDLSIPYENIIPPTATLPERILEVVSYLERQNRLAEIIDWILKNRPRLDMDELHHAWVKDGRPLLDMPPDFHKRVWTQP